MEATVYNKEGGQAGKIKLDEKFFGLSWNADLIHQVVTSMQANKRAAIAHAKDRSEVSGGGKKPWRQKGTGRARHGSTRSPIWVGGGVAHGPSNERNFTKKINKKMKTRALFTVLSQKLRDNEVIFLDELPFPVPKVREARLAVEALAQLPGFEKISYKRGNRAYLALPGADNNAFLSFRNISSIKVEEVRNANPLDILNYKYIIIVNPTEAIKTLTSRLK
jgi:large subunit ribosomal protein L4